MGCFNVIWQGDVNAAALRLLAHASCPPLAINLTGAEKLSVRDVAGRLGELMGKPVRFAGAEADTALLSDASRAHRLLSSPPTPLERVLRWTARWVAAGGKTLGKPTHFQSRDGKY
jgi:nucleoside-diphosphate-sugar epimerase